MDLLNSGKKWDLAIVDPPYTDEFRVVNSEECAKLGDYRTDSLNNNAPTDEYFKEVIRVSKNQIIWGVNYYKYYLGAGRIVWDKDNTGNYSDCELAYHSFGNVIRKFQWRWNGMLQGDMKNKQIRIHPTEKPIQLYKWLLRNYAKEGETILDTHGGSLSIAIACWDLGFDLDICELDKDYFNDAVKRFENHISQTQLF
jgi:site-specific DNA-methyltransferase (adenine-specific)